MKNKNTDRTAISPTRKENFSLWFQEVVKEAEIAEMAHVRGCMVIKPWGYGIWENIQYFLGNLIKDTGAENVYFPLFIPLSYIEKEAQHIEGFAKQMAVVTHTRLEKDNTTGELKPTGELSEPILVRPTSETIIGESMSKWIKSYRDLPIRLNQWCNIVRWEMRPRILLRTVEFLWQEGHTAFETQEEAENDAKFMLGIYTEFLKNYLAIPLIKGIKPLYDRFPGAENTYCIEALMQDGKALQAGTSHYLGNLFAKAADIKFLDKDNNIKYAYTSSWGVTTRLIGGLVMIHSDDDGMRVPPKIAPQHIVIYPILRNVDNENNTNVIEYCNKILDALNSKTMSNGIKIKIKLDNRLIPSSEKKWQWIKKGIPIQLEVGAKDLQDNIVTFRLRNEKSNQKHQMSFNEFVEKASSILEDIQVFYFQEAQKRLSQSIKNINSFEELKEYFSNEETPTFVLAPYKDNNKEDERLNELQITIRCLPLEQDLVEKECILSGEKTNTMAIFARAY